MRRGLSLALLATVVVGTPPPFQVAAYLPEWRYEGANWVTICETVTHLILFSIEVGPTGAPAGPEVPRGVPR